MASVEFAGHGEQVAQSVNVAVPDAAGVSADHPEQTSRSFGGGQLERTEKSHLALGDRPASVRTP
jgi:hypothetical protein